MILVILIGNVIAYLFPCMQEVSSTFPNKKCQKALNLSFDGGSHQKSEF